MSNFFLVFSCVCETVRLFFELFCDVLLAYLSALPLISSACAGAFRKLFFSLPILSLFICTQQRLTVKPNRDCFYSALHYFCIIFLLFVTWCYLPMAVTRQLSFDPISAQQVEHFRFAFFSQPVSHLFFCIHHVRIEYGCYIFFFFLIDVAVVWCLLLRKPM